MVSAQLRVNYFISYRLNLPLKSIVPVLRISKGAVDLHIIGEVVINLTLQLGCFFKRGRFAVRITACSNRNMIDHLSSYLTVAVFFFLIYFCTDLLSYKRGWILTFSHCHLVNRKKLSVLVLLPATYCVWIGYSAMSG